MYDHESCMHASNRALNMHRNDLEVLKTIRKSSVQCCKQYSLCFLQASMDDYICNNKENA